MKVLGLSFSPRKLGNCEIAIKEIFLNLSPNIEYDFINISKYNLKPCIACYKCLFENEKCPLDDDFYEIFNKILDSDALIMACPSYFLGPNSSFKLFIDRFLISYNYHERLYNKETILISIAGIENGGEGYVDLSLLATARLLNLNVKEHLVLYAALPGEVILNSENKKKLKYAAEKLFVNKNVNKNEYQCNICGNQYFEFLDNNEIQCLVCKHKGSLQLVNNKIKVKMQKDNTIFYGDEEANLRHKEWLKNMKERFITERKKIKEVTRKYLKI